MYAYGLAKLMSQHGTKRKELVELLNVSRQSVHTKITEGKFKENEIELLAKFYDVPVEHFYYHSKTLAEEPAGEYGTNGNAIEKIRCEIRVLREILNNKDKEIERLNREIGKLESKLENNANP